MMTLLSPWNVSGCQAFQQVEQNTDSARQLQIAKATGRHPPVGYTNRE